MRIAIAGFQHETNTFVSTPTTLEDFKQADSWPELLIGSKVITETQAMNLPIAGFAQAAQSHGEEILPILWCAAEPGGRVVDHAFETISKMILEGITQATPVDAVYLDLHGAMVLENCEDGEGRLLTRIRDAIGPETPLVASLDMHANISQQMVQQSDILTVYRTYPHLDMAETGARAYHHLCELMTNGRPAKAWRQGNYLIPAHVQQTGAGAAKVLYDTLSEVNTDKDAQLVELALGFTAADVTDVGPSVLAYAVTQTQADALADRMTHALAQAEPLFDESLLTPSEAVAQAKSRSTQGTVVIADVQDNPGAGASSDTTGLLRELISQNVPPTLLGLIHDPALADQAHKHGVGKTFTAQIGGRSQGDYPVSAAVTVTHLSQGECLYTGQMYGGGVCTLGPSTALHLDDTNIDIVVTSIRNQCLDQAHFRHFGLEPQTANIICVKSTAHFRADFEPIAHQVLTVAVPGLYPCQFSPGQYRNVRHGLKRYCHVD